MADQSINTGANYVALQDLAGNRETEIIRAAQKMGLSERDTVRMIQRALKRASDLRADPNGINIILDNIIDQSQKIEAINNAAPAEIPGFRQVPNSFVEDGEFGNQNELQNFGGVNKDGNINDADQAISEQSKVRGKSDSNQLKRTYWDKAAREYKTEELYVPDGQPTPRRFQSAAKSGDFGIFAQNQVAPVQQVLAEEARRLREGVDVYGYDAFPGSAQLLGDIELELSGTAGRDAERALTREMVAQDRDGFSSDEVARRLGLQLSDEFGRESTFGSNVRAMPINAYTNRAAELTEQIKAIRQYPEQVERNNFIAQADANLIGQDFTVGGRGVLADEAMANIGDISSLGTVKSGEFATSPFIDRGPANPNFLDIGLPGTYQGSGSAGRMAGPLLAQQQWLVDNVGGITEDVMRGGRGSGGEIALDAAINGAQSESGLGNYRQLAIGEQLAKLQGGIEGITVGARKRRGKTPARKGTPIDLGGLQIRNLDQLQQAVGLVIAAKQGAGENFWRKDGDVNRLVTNPGINEVLQLARINDGDKNDIANALFQIESANRNPANSSAKARFKKNINLDGETNMGGRRLVRIQGAEPGSEFRVVRAPGKVVQGGGFHKQLGNGNAGVSELGANEKVTMRDGSRKNVKALFQSADGFGGGFDRNEAPLTQDELAQVRMPFIGAAEPEGAPKPAWVNAAGARMTPEERVNAWGEKGNIANEIVRRKEVQDAKDRGVRFIDGVPQRAERQRNMDPGVFEPQAPDPWTQQPATGPGFTEVRTPSMRTRPQAALPYGVQTSGPTQDVTRPLTNELKNELAALSSGFSEQGPRPASNYSDPGIKADGPSPIGLRRRNGASEARLARRKVSRYGRGAAITGGVAAAIAGLDGLIGGERDRRNEQEQYQ